MKRKRSTGAYGFVSVNGVLVPSSRPIKEPIILIESDEENNAPEPKQDISPSQNENDDHSIVFESEPEDSAEQSVTEPQLSLPINENCGDVEPEISSSRQFAYVHMNWAASQQLSEMHPKLQFFWTSLPPDGRNDMGGGLFVLQNYNHQCQQLINDVNQINRTLFPEKYYEQEFETRRLSEKRERKLIWDDEASYLYEEVETTGPVLEEDDTPTSDEEQEEEEEEEIPTDDEAWEREAQRRERILAPVQFAQPPPKYRQRNVIESDDDE
jgi:hypothetical protein